VNKSETDKEKNTVVNINKDDKYYNFRLQKSIVDNTAKVIGDAVVSSAGTIASNTAVAAATTTAIST
jgi:hypothetical protein